MSTYQYIYIAQPSNIHRQGNLAIYPLHRWLSSFCRACGATNNNIFPAIESAKQSPLYKALHGKFVPELVNILYDNELMESEIVYLTPSQAGGRAGGQAGGQASHATDPSKPGGVHYSERLRRDTMSKKAQSARTTESHRKANLTKQENGTLGKGLHPNADRDFIINCDSAKQIIAEVRIGCEYCLFNQLY